MGRQLTNRRHHVELVEFYGSDAMVVNAARVSHASDNATRYIVDGDELTEDGQRIIRYMARNKHWTPFAHVLATFRIVVPIFVANQLKRHVVGVALNEVSRRYVDDKKAPPEFATIEWRCRNANVKQGSGERFPDYKQEALTNRYYDVIETCMEAYTYLLNECHVAPEQARAVLPMALMTEFYWTGSVAFFARVCGLRIEEHAQAESRWVAEDISRYMVRGFPVSWRALADAEDFPVEGFDE